MSKSFSISLQKSIFELFQHNQPSIIISIFIIVVSFIYIKYRKSNINKSSPKRILITGANGNVGYSLAFMIAQGRMINDQPIILHLFDLPQFESNLEGVKCELIDGAFENLVDIVVSSKPEIAFKDIDYALLCGAKPRLQGMERSDLLLLNKEIFKIQGKYINDYANKNVKVCVVGNPANTNCLILIENAPSINPKNFSALTRLDHNRLLSELAFQLKVSPKEISKIEKICIIGNHSQTQYPCTEYGTYNGKKIKEILSSDFLYKDLIGKIQKRGNEIIEKRKVPSAASAASAVCDHMKDWIYGSNNRWVSMAVVSNGEYSVPKGIVFSYPVTCDKGEWKIVDEFVFNIFSKHMFEITLKELLVERSIVERY